jgi:hypothetical protein
MNVATMDEKRFRSAMRDILRASELETHPSPLSSSSQQAARISTSYSVYPRCIDYKLSAVGKIYVPSNTYQNLSLLENQLGQADGFRIVDLIVQQTSRKGHRKLRQGCYNCKKRKIKVSSAINCL